MKYLLLLSTVMVTGTLAISKSQYIKNIKKDIGVKMLSIVTMVLCNLLVSFGFEEVVY